MEHSPRIAIVDDDPLVRRLLRTLLTEDGASVVEHDCGRTALDLVDHPVDLVCLDLGLNDMPGLSVMRHLRAQGLEVPIVVVTAESKLEIAVEAMRSGAYDYLTKPIDPERLRQAVRRAWEREQLRSRLTRLESERDAGADRSMIASSDAMRRVLAQVERVKESDVTVCITGESGTGKELVARAIHERGRRCRAPFVAINCAAIPQSLQESELFGHERGSFTGALAQHKGRFEQAHRGTLFLDELGEMSASTQASLLRALQERTIRRVGGTVDIPVDVRVVAATHRDLAAEVRAGRFREDLYFRLFVFPIQIPPLRERRADIPALVGHFLQKLRSDSPHPIERCSVEALEALLQHEWPGNVRELQNVVHRALLAADGDEITLAHLPPELRALSLPSMPTATAKVAEEPILPLRELEKRAIARALEATKGSVEKAARLLGMGRATLYRRLTESGQMHPSRTAVGRNSQVRSIDQQSMDGEDSVRRIAESSPSSGGTPFDAERSGVERVA